MSIKILINRVYFQKQKIGDFQYPLLAKAKKMKNFCRSVTNNCVFVFLCSLIFSGLSFAQGTGGPPSGNSGGNAPFWRKSVTPLGNFTWSSIFAPPQGQPIFSSGSKPWWYMGQGIYVWQYWTYFGSHTGSVHFKYEWIAPNGEKSPKNVVVHKNVTASWSAPLIGGSGSCSSSIPGAPVYWNDGFRHGESLNNQLYEVKNSASGIVEFDISMSAIASGTGSESVFSWGPVACSVSADSDITSIKVDVNGIVRDGMIWKTLTGMKVSSALNTGSYVQIPGNYNWDGSGPIFKEFYVSPDQKIGERRLHVAPDKVNAVFVTHYFGEGSGVVTCSGKISTPSGQLTVEAESENFTIVRPLNNLTILDGSVKYQSNNFGPTANENALAGSVWIGYTVVPAPFNSVVSSCGFAQLINKSEAHCYSTLPSPQDHFVGNPNIINPATAFLDQQFPYSSKTGMGAIAFNGDDSPHQPLFPILGHDLSFYKSTCSDEFETWVIFKPNDGQWISLGKFTWKWSGIMTRISSTEWSLVADPVTHTEQVYTSNHPKWSDRSVNGPLVTAN